MAKLPDPPPMGAPFFDQGQVSDPWFKFFQGVYTASATGGTGAVINPPSTGGGFLDGGYANTDFSGGSPSIDLGSA